MSCPAVRFDCDIQGGTFVCQMLSRIKESNSPLPTSTQVHIWNLFLPCVFYTEYRGTILRRAVAKQPSLLFWFLTVHQKNIVDTITSRKVKVTSGCSRTPRLSSNYNFTRRRLQERSWFSKHRKAKAVVRLIHPILLQFLGFPIL